MQKMPRLLRYRLLTSDPEHLRTVYTVSEGIENRLKRAASVAESWEEFLEEDGHKTLYGGENTPHGGSYSYGSDRGTVSFSAR